MTQPNTGIQQAARLRFLLTLPDLSATVADILDELHAGFSVGASALEPLRIGEKVCGPAITLRYRRVDGELLEKATEVSGLGDKPLYIAAQPGDIAVIECPDAEVAVLGAVSSRWAQLAGLSAVIVDGAVRDSMSLAGKAVSVWSAARTPRSALGRYAVDTIGSPITLAGNTVHPGDIVAADDDGVAVVPAALIGEVADRCAQAAAAEQELLTLIENCSTVGELTAALHQMPSR